MKCLIKRAILSKTKTKTQKPKTPRRASHGAFQALISTTHGFKGGKLRIQKCTNSKNGIRRAKGRCEQWLVKNSKGKEKRKKMNDGFGEML